MLKNKELSEDRHWRFYLKCSLETLTVHSRTPPSRQKTDMNCLSGWIWAWHTMHCARGLGDTLEHNSAASVRAEAFAALTRRLFRMGRQRSEVGSLLTFNSSDHFAAKLSITALEMKEALLTNAC